MKIGRHTPGDLAAENHQDRETKVAHQRGPGEHLPPGDRDKPCRDLKGPPLTPVCSWRGSTGCQAGSRQICEVTTDGAPGVIQRYPFDGGRFGSGASTRTAVQSWEVPAPGTDRTPCPFPCTRQGRPRTSTAERYRFLVFGEPGCSTRDQVGYRGLERSSGDTFVVTARHQSRGVPIEAQVCALGFGPSAPQRLRAHNPSATSASSS